MLDDSMGNNMARPISYAQILLALSLIASYLPKTQAQWIGDGVEDVYGIRQSKLREEQSRREQHKTQLANEEEMRSIEAYDIDRTKPCIWFKTRKPVKSTIIFQIVFKDQSKTETKICKLQNGEKKKCCNLEYGLSYRYVYHLYYTHSYGIRASTEPEIKLNIPNKNEINESRLEEIIQTTNPQKRILDDNIMRIYVNQSQRCIQVETRTKIPEDREISVQFYPVDRRAPQSKYCHISYNSENPCCSLAIGYEYTIRFELYKIRPRKSSIYLRRFNPKITKWRIPNDVNLTQYTTTTQSTTSERLTTAGNKIVVTSKKSERKLAYAPVKYLVYSNRIVFYVEEEVNYDIEITCQTLYQQQYIVLYENSKETSCESLSPQTEYTIKISADEKWDKILTLRTTNKVLPKPYRDTNDEISTTVKINESNSIPIIPIVSLSICVFSIFTATLYITIKNCIQRRKIKRRVVRETEPMEMTYDRIT